MRRSSMFVACLAGLASLLVGPLAAAQDATPAAEPIVPAANQCTVEPRPIEFFQQFVGTPAAEATPAGATPAGATPAEATPTEATSAGATPDAASFQMPEGEPADRETRAAVLDTVRQVGACLNAGNFLAFYALFTDEYFQRLVETEGPLPEEDLAFLTAEPEPLPAENQAGILAIVDVRQLPDGRVAGLFDLQDPIAEPPGPARFLYIFVEQDGRWLIDEETMLGRVEPSQIGTPAA